MAQPSARRHRDYASLWEEYGKVSVVGLSLVLALASLSVIFSHSVPRKLEVSFLDVGQGDAILIRTPSGHDVLVDGGPSDIILERLDERMDYFDRSIDVVIATHGDADHVTGLIPVFRKYDVGRIVRSPIDAETNLFAELTRHVEAEGAEVSTGRRGDVIDFGDGVKMYVLYPSTVLPPKTDTNDASVSVAVEYGEHTFLLSGDLSSKHEAKLVGGHVPQRVTVFKAGHHGSKTSSGAALLSYIRPEYAVISAGKENRYGHPHADTLDRLAAYAEETLSTIDRGTITFASDGAMIEVLTND